MPAEVVAVPDRTAANKEKPAPVLSRRAWQVLEAERQRRLLAASERLQAAILGAWRPELVAALGQRGV